MNFGPGPDEGESCLDIYVDMAAEHGHLEQASCISGLYPKSPMLLYRARLKGGPQVM